MILVGMIRVKHVHLMHVPSSWSRAGPAITQNWMVCFKFHVGALISSQSLVRIGEIQLFHQVVNKKLLAKISITFSRKYRVTIRSGCLGLYVFSAASYCCTVQSVSENGIYIIQLLLELFTKSFLETDWKARTMMINRVDPGSVAAVGPCMDGLRSRPSADDTWTL